MVLLGVFAILDTYVTGGYRVLAGKKDAGPSCHDLCAGQLSSVFLAEVLPVVMGPSAPGAADCTRMVAAASAGDLAGRVGLPAFNTLYGGLQI